jgi:outer membrane protein TolC
MENINKTNKKMNKYLILFFLLLIFKETFGLSMEEAIELAKKNNPQIRQYLHSVKSKEYQLKSSIGNFIPTIRYNFGYTHYNDNPTDYFDRNHTLSLEWNVFNQWNNFYQYKTSKINYKLENENYKKIELDIIYKVKVAYINAVANYRIKEFRKKQLNLAKIDLEVAKEKFKLGLVKKSDVLNSRVRYEQTKYNYIKALTDYKTSLVELNSLIGLPLDKEEKLDINVLEDLCIINLPKYETLKKYLYKNRPELKIAKYQIRLSEESLRREKFSFAPSVTLFYKKVKDYNSLYGNSDYDYYGLSLNWTIFNGLKRFNNIISAKEKELSQREFYNETKRQLELSLYQKYLQLSRSLENLQVARVLLEQAELNYKQTLGEYKVGKNDIVALVNAEINLSNARETLIKSLQEIALLKVEIERELGVSDLNKLCELE